ncbi:MAG: FtsQ-type POTRA domain-containing protein [Sandaracinaceae bacterium]|nr:FtsQ-type POTRA domain-containing protein [Sandaracinaceae bacterium]MBK8407087.1 FtsQ-type POTRA domain-containing protein [Sandaracinaceae bacterium]MBP7681953.1 FtsQ-type POTRA domain-containing protein [Deltaproteobacteria bacterium]
MVALRASIRGFGDRVWQRTRGPLRILAKLVVLVACVIGTIAVGRLIERHVRTSPAFAIRTITFAGHEQLEETELLEASGLSVGQNVFELGPEDVRERLSRHPWIATVEVQRRLPGTFTIDVRERRAVAILALDQLYLVGEDGTVFKQLGAEDLVDLPVIVGIPRDRFVRDRAYRASILLEIVAVMHDYRGVGLWRREPIAEVHVEADDSLSLYVGADTTYVRLGRGPFRDRLQKLRRVFDALDARETRAAYIYADNVRRPDRVTVRLREERELVAAH